MGKVKVADIPQAGILNNLKQLLIIPLRILLTAYGFLQFAIQVLWLGKWQMPRIIQADQDKIKQRHKALMKARQHVVVYLKTLSLLTLVRFEVKGQPNPEPCVVVANHPSLLDFIVIIKDFPHAVCLYKSQSLKNPVLSSFVQVAGYIQGMDGSPGGSKRIISESQQRLSEGHHVAIFPEGTRSPSATEIGKFRTTGFHAAISSNVAVQPVAIHCTPLFLGKGQSWISFCERSNHMLIEYLPPISVHELPECHQNASGLAQAARTAILHALQSGEIKAKVEKMDY